MKPRTRLLLLFAGLAAVNLAAGCVLASQVSRTFDRESVMRWEASWLFERSDVYRSADSGTAYPPYAIVPLSPLGLLPFDVAVPLWAGVNLFLAVLAPYLAARFFQPRAPFRIILLPVLM